MNSNFYNISCFQDFEEALFQCDLGESLGFSRRCYICDNYDHRTLEIPDCLESCWCHTTGSKIEVINHLCCKIFEEIQIKEVEPKEIFIYKLGLHENSKKLFVSYFSPFETVLSFTEQPFYMQYFTDYFHYTINSRLMKFGPCLIEMD